MHQPSFNFDESQRRKDEGMALAALSRSEQLAYARGIAYRIAISRDDRCCWADLVQEELIQYGINLGPAAGSLFKDKGTWFFTGRRVMSRQVNNHAREQKVWQLK